MAVPEIETVLKELQTSDVELYGVKLKKLNQLTRKVSQSIKANNNTDEADNILNSIQPTDFYSKRTRLELANVLQRPGPILDVFISEDKVLIDRALQFRWIYTSNLFLNGNNNLVQIFPRISYSCRKRIIHRFSKYCQDEQRLEVVYRSIEEKYGIATAIPLLPACSQSFIEPILMAEKKVQLTSRQLEQILCRYPALAISYLEKFYSLLWKARESNKYLINNSYQFVLVRLVKLQPEEFMNLYEKYGDIMADLRLGPRLTRFLLSNENVDRILEHASKYCRILHQNQVMKMNTEKFKSFFTALLPLSITSFQLVFEVGRQGYRGEKDSLFIWLQKFPLEKRFSVLEEAFEAVYKKKLLDFPEFMTSRLIQLLKKEDRDKWVDMRLSLPDSQYLYQSVGVVPSHHEGFWEAFRSPERSIPQLKKYLAVESEVHRRAELASMLVLTCSVNNDLAALEGVCKYVAGRFRNDHIQVRSEFLNALVSRFDLLKLNDEHWSSINELLQISSINNEFSQHSNYILRILELSIHHRLSRNLPVESQIQHYIKIQTRSYCWGESWNILIKFPPLEKQCLKLFAQQIGQIYPGGGPFPSNSSLTAGIISMAESISGWNRRHPKDLMSSTEFPWLTSRLQEILDGVDERNKTRLILAFQRDPAAREKYFPTLLKSNPLPPVLLHFLRTRPQLLSSNSEHILSFILRALSLKNYSAFFKTLRYQGHETIIKNFLKIALAIIGEEDEMLRERINAIKISSVLMSTDMFLDLARKYYPDEGKVDVSSDDIETKYEMTKAISGSLKNMDQPSKALPVILEFCKGDYLKLTIGSLYSLCYNSPETEAIKFLQELVNRPVSVKKHAIRLMTTITNKQTMIKVLTELWESEKNMSIRHLIFQRIFQLFLFESSEGNWKLLKTAIQGLDENSLSSIGSLGSLDHIPDHKFPEYVETCWNVVEGMAKPVTWALSSILQGVTPERISLLDSTFLKSIFKKYLFLHQDQNLESNVVYLAVKYLLYHRKDEQATQVDLVLDCIQERLIGDQWDKPDENIITLYPCRQTLSSFIEQLSIESFKCPLVKLRDDGNAKSLMETLVDRLCTAVKPADIFIDTLFLRLSVIFHSRPEIKAANDLFEIGKQVGKLADELIQVYQPEIICIFSETLKRFVSLCYKFRLTENEGNGGRIIHVVDGILHSTGSIDTQIIAAQFLSSTYPKPHVLEDEYKRLVKELRNIEDKTVQIFVNYKLTQSRPIGYYDMLV